MLPDAAVFVPLLLLGAWAGIDGTSAGQFMISRPVVAATLAGWIAGDPAAGALVGLILEALYLTVLPVGASRYPEVGPAAVCAAGVLALAPGVPGALVTSLLFAICWAWIGGLTVRQLRQANIRLVTGAAVAGGSAEVMQRQHLLALLADVLRAAALVAIGIPLLALIVQWTGQVWVPETGLTRVAVWSLAAGGIAAGIRLFGDGRVPLFGVGVACGLALLILL